MAVAFLFCLFVGFSNAYSMKGFYEKQYWGHPQSSTCQGNPMVSSFIPVNHCSKLMHSDFVIPKTDYAYYEYKDGKVIVWNCKTDFACNIKGDDKNCSIVYSNAVGECHDQGQSFFIEHQFGELETPGGGGWLEYYFYPPKGCDWNSTAQVFVSHPPGCQNSCPPDMGCTSSYEKCEGDTVELCQFDGKDCQGQSSCTYHGQECEWGFYFYSRYSCKLL